MPELPEVENVKRRLAPELTGRRIEEVAILRPVVAHPSEEGFCSKAGGKTIAAVERRGKFLFLCLDDGARILVHLRMTGRLLVSASDAPLPPHTHAIFFLSDKNRLLFSDARRFGRLWLIEKDEKDIFSGVEKLGYEPFDENLTAAFLFERYKKRGIAVKQALLEQTAVAGIGNIYADESLFAAKIRSDRPVSSLSIEEWIRLYESVKSVLSAAIERNADYTHGEKSSKNRPPRFQVYGRANKPCRCCGMPVSRIAIAGRSSYFCPNCQK